MIVADTNLIAASLLPGTERDVANAVLARDSRWAAPLLWRSEMRNVLVQAMRRSELTAAAAEMVCTRAQALLEGRQNHVADGAVMRRAMESGCTAYDCEFVVLAEELGVPLVTFDREVLRAFSATAIHPERFASGAFWGDRMSEAVVHWRLDRRVVRRRAPRRRARRAIRTSGV